MCGNSLKSYTTVINHDKTDTAILFDVIAPYYSHPMIIPHPRPKGPCHWKDVHFQIPWKWLWQLDEIDKQSIASWLKGGDIGIVVSYFPLFFCLYRIETRFKSIITSYYHIFRFTFAFLYRIGSRFVKRCFYNVSIEYDVKMKIIKKGDFAIAISHIPLFYFVYGIETPFCKLGCYCVYQRGDVEITLTKNDAFWLVIFLSL